MRQPNTSKVVCGGVRRAILGALLGSTFILAGCGTERDAGGPTDPRRSPSDPDPGAPAIEANVVQRSEGVDLVLSYPDPGAPPDREVVVFLQQASDDQDWRTSYTLYAPLGDGTEPSFVEGYADEVPDSLVRGKGPDRFLAPALNQGSTYRVCRNFIVGEPPRSQLGCSEPFGAET